MIDAKLIFDDVREVVVTARSKKELFGNIYTEIKKQNSECSVQDKTISLEYNKWCADHTLTPEIPKRITNWYQAKCGFAVPYSKAYRKMNKIIIK